MNAADKGPDLCAGIALGDLADGAMLAGHVRGEPALLARRGERLFAIGGRCSHDGAPLAQGLLVGDTVRCPWHHACFSLASGEALRAPALDDVPCWRVERRDGRACVTASIARSPRAAPRSDVRRVVIVGGGAAGNAAAEMLRRLGFDGSITLLNADDAMPSDRPKLSKNYLSGQVAEDAIDLRRAAFYRDHDIDLRHGVLVDGIDPLQRDVLTTDGGVYHYDALLLATGAEPVRLPIPGAELAGAPCLRSGADSRAIVARAREGSRAVVIGSSFIAMEAAAALRDRGVAVTVVTQETVPMARVLGPEIGRHLRALHERHGVRFHTEAQAAAIEGGTVTLRDGRVLQADFIVAGIGVAPATAVAARAGLALDRGVTVDAQLRTSATGVFAAGDIARWPDPHSGRSIRVEHWVVAERQGQTAARNILGAGETFDAVPFFWTAQFDFSLRYMGHAETWDRIEIDGDLAAGATIRYKQDGRMAAAATVERDLEALRLELAMEAAPDPPVPG